MEECLLLVEVEAWDVQFCEATLWWKAQNNGWTGFTKYADLLLTESEELIKLKDYYAIKLFYYYYFL